MKKSLFVALLVFVSVPAVQAAYMADPNPGRAWYWGSTPNRLGSSYITWNDYNTQDWRGADLLRVINPSTGSATPNYNDYCHPYGAWPTINKTQNDSWSLNVDFVHDNETWNGYGFVGLGDSTNCTNMLGVGSNQQWQPSGKTRIFASGVDGAGDFSFANVDIDAEGAARIWVRALMQYDGATKLFTAQLYDRDGVTTGRSAGDLIATLTVDMTGKTFNLNTVRIGNLAYGWVVNDQWAKDFRAMNFYYTDDSGMTLDYSGTEVQLPEPAALTLLGIGAMGLRARKKAA